MFECVEGVSLLILGLHVNFMWLNFGQFSDRGVFTETIHFSEDFLSFGLARSDLVHVHLLAAKLRVLLSLSGSQHYFQAGRGL